MAEFTFRLVTPQRLLFEGPALSVQAPGSEGYLGILANHAPLITALKPGKLEVKDPKGIVTTYAVSGGFLEVSDNRASVLAEMRTSRTRSRRRIDEGPVPGRTVATSLSGFRILSPFASSLSVGTDSFSKSSEYRR